MESENVISEAHEKPDIIKKAVYLIYGSLGLGLLKSLVDSNTTMAPVGFVVFIVASVFVLLIFIAYQISKGKNWARIIFTILTVLGLIAWMPALKYELNNKPLVIALISLAQAFMQFMAIVLLFLKSSNDWFRLKRAS